MRFDITDRVPAIAELAGEVRPAFAGLWESVFGECGAVLVCPLARRVGGTTVACGLGLAGVSDGRARRVVVVDCNLRRPGVRRMLNLADGVGLAEVLAGQVALDDALQRVGPDELDVLTAGAAEVRQRPGHFSEPGERPVTWSRPSQIIAELRRLYDYVIIDAPPVGAQLDAEALTPPAGRALLVARAGRTSPSAIDEARQRLESVGGNVLGVVMNHCPAPGGS